MSHRWRELSGAADVDWQVFQCERCRRWTVKSIFGFRWPDVLGFVFRRLSCDG